MTITLIRGLAMWAGCLVALLLCLSGLSSWPLIGALIVVASGVGAVWHWTVRRVRRLQETLLLNDLKDLPSASYRHPVILVCGTASSLMFGPYAQEKPTLRLTHHACYVGVQDVAGLSGAVANVVSLRPEWRRQLSVMFVVNPQTHEDPAVLAGQLRALTHQLTLARRGTLALPLVIISHLASSLDTGGAWFSWSGKRSSPDAWVGGSRVCLDDWQRQPVDAADRQTRFHAVTTLRSLAEWLNTFVVPHLGARWRQPDHVPVLWSITLTPAASSQVDGHLWGQWLVNKTGWVGAHRGNTEVALPFPDAVVAELPRHSRDTATQRAGLIALWMLAGASVIALINSAWQNTLLLREVSDDLRRYASVSSLTDRNAPQLALLEDAVRALRQDARRLDEHYRHGEPLSLALGLYRGERLRAPLWEAITGYRPPPTESAADASPVRLDSLSLFHPGSAHFKPDAAQVLIDALVHIKIRAGWLIVITGHTDATGGDAQNLTLSRARAEAVRDWMQRMGGIPDSCFAVQGLGASQPVAGNETEQGRAANRRVDIRLVPERGACELPATVPGQPPTAQPASVER